MLVSTSSFLPPLISSPLPLIVRSSFIDNAGYYSPTAPERKKKWVKNSKNKSKINDNSLSSIVCSPVNSPMINNAMVDKQETTQSADTLSNVNDEG
jgi:hypothetical protein